MTGARLSSYPAPANGASKLGFIREYGYSFARASWLAAGERQRRRESYSVRTQYWCKIRPWLHPGFRVQLSAMSARARRER